MSDWERLQADANAAALAKRIAELQDLYGASILLLNKATAEAAAAKRERDRLKSCVTAIASLRSIVTRDSHE